MLLLLDNYDSFTWNLVHLLGMLSPDLDIEVHRNDALTVESHRGSFAAGDRHFPGAVHPG